MVKHGLHFSGAAALKVRRRCLLCPSSTPLHSSDSPPPLLPFTISTGVLSITLDLLKVSPCHPYLLWVCKPPEMQRPGRETGQRVSSESCDQDRLTPARNRRSSGSVHGRTRVCSIKQDINSFRRNQIHFLDFVLLVRGIYSRQIEASLSHARL